MNGVLFGNELIYLLISFKNGKLTESAGEDDNGNDEYSYEDGDAKTMALLPSAMPTVNTNASKDRGE